MFNYIVVVYNLISYICKKIFINHLNYLSNMEFRIERTVSFVETACIEADSLEDLKEKLPSETLDWSVDFEYNPTVERVVAFDDNDEFELPVEILEEDYVEAENGCIIFNREEFDSYHPLLDI